MRRKVSALAAAVLVAIVGMSLAASPASAHDTSTKVKVACNAQGTYDVTWTVKNWSGGGTSTVTASNRGSVPVGTTFSDGQTRSFTEVVGAPATLTLKVTLHWPDGVTYKDEATLASSAFPTGCVQPDQPVTPTAPSVVAPTCEAAGSLVVPADTDKVSYGQNPAGSGPGVYQVTATAKPGYKLEGTSSWDLVVLPKKTGDDCLTSVTPEAPSVTAPTCLATGSLVVPADTDKVSYSQDPAGSGPGTYTVTATAKPGYKITGKSSWELVVAPAKTGDECLVPVTPTAPEVVAPTCLTPGILVVPAGTDKVSYSQDPAGSGPGTYTVTATAKPGYKLDGTGSWNLTVLPQKTQADGCLLSVVAAPASVVAPTCDVDGSLVVPADTDSVAYTQDPAGSGPGSYTVTATPKPGFVIEGPDSWALEVLPKKTQADGCTVPVAPVAPTVVPITECGTVGSIALPTTTGVDYAVTEGNGQSGPYVVTATAQAGYALVDGAQSVWSGDLGTITSCPDPVVDPPVVDPPGPGPDSEGQDPEGPQAAGPPTDAVLPATGAGDWLLPLGAGALVAIGLGIALARPRKSAES